MWKRGSLKAFFLVILILLLSGCTGASKPVISQGLELRGGLSQLPEELLLMPPEVNIFEVSAGGVVEEDPEWSRQAKNALKEVVNDYFSNSLTARIVPMPELTAEEQRLVREHVLLYDVVGSQAYVATTLPQMGWKHKVEEFDYSLGSGLQFLKERSGADAALILIGVDFISSGGRKAMMTMAALVGVSIPVGNSYIQAGVVDLESGEILWFNHGLAVGSRDLRRVEDSRAMFEDMFAGYRQ